MSGETDTLTEEQLLALWDLSSLALGYKHSSGVPLPEARDLVTVLIEPLTLADELRRTARRESV